MIVFPNAKINLGLNVVSRRTDGYHEIETVFYPINWTDALEVNKSEILDFNSTGIEIPGVGANNLCVKAYKLIMNVFSLEPINIHLHKNIPIGAGLGGGSADGAFMLLLINEFFNLKMSNEQLKLIAKELGADCAFFLENQPSFAKGIGNEFEEVLVNLSEYKLVVAYPNIHVDTGWAYSKINPKPSEISVKHVINNYSISDWKEYLKNDFEEPVFKEFPTIKQLKETMYENNAVYASMSGSGSTVFGLFNTNNTLEELMLHFNSQSYQYRILDL
ncbi:UNVERIFIED_CONTAM: hypothetical protein GTU68_023191 [Idotea baltica]|nr:hypothetical protein [Idotea baltica]